MIKITASNKLMTLIFVLVLCSCIGPVKDIRYEQNSRITIRDSVSIICFTLFNYSQKVKPKSKNTYTWYGTGKIYNTQGDFGGRLVDGTMKVFDQHGNLKEKGEFYRGIKTGHWTKWAEDGKISEIISFRNGSPKDTLRFPHP